VCRLGRRARVRPAGGHAPPRGPYGTVRLGSGDGRRDRGRFPARPAGGGARGVLRHRPGHRGRRGPGRRAPGHGGAAGHSSRETPAAPAARTGRGRYGPAAGPVDARRGTRPAGRRASGQRRRPRPWPGSDGRQRGRSAPGRRVLPGPAGPGHLRQPPRRPAAGPAARGAAGPPPVGGRALAEPDRLRGPAARRPAVAGAGALPRPASGRTGEAGAVRGPAWRARCSRWCP
jgi:hypothetical protein